MTAQAATQAAAPQVLPQDRAGFGVYLHWPFCRSKCPYCDFNSHVRESIDQARWRAALLSDLAHAAAKGGPRRVKNGRASCRERGSQAGSISVVAVSLKKKEEIK